VAATVTAAGPAELLRLTPESLQQRPAAGNGAWQWRCCATWALVARACGPCSPPTETLFVPALYPRWTQPCTPSDDRHPDRPRPTRRPLRHPLRRLPPTPDARPPRSSPATTPSARRVRLWRFVGGALVALSAAVALAVLLIVNPPLGLTRSWKLAIPLVPALLVITGLWRQICPMATMNQIPRLTGWQRPRDLPDWARASAFGIAVALFVGAVSLRVPPLNQAGRAVGLGVIGVLLLALAGGFAFKAQRLAVHLCPWAPIQRTYGQAPLVVVKNGYREPCVGCQKSCYDFNPRAGVLRCSDDDPRHAAQRRLFFGRRGSSSATFCKAPSRPSNT
jgi:hypothetical protein